MSDPIKRPRGRPPKAKIEASVAATPAQSLKMKAKPNWEAIDTDDVDTPDRLRIDPALVPEGMSLQWVTTSIYGKDMPERLSTFEKKGWTVVHPEDFDGVFDGMFNPRGHQGPVMMENNILVARPFHLTERARVMDKRRALEQVAIKEAALTGGDVGVTAGMDSRHATALRSNRISRTVEPISVPDK